MTFFSSLAWTGISFVLFTALVAIISAWKTRDEQLDTAEGYFLAGRGLPGVVIAGSLLLTNLSAEQLVGLNGQSWKTNMGPIAWEVGSMFTLLVLAFCKKKTKTDTELHPVTAYNPTSREYDYRQRENLVEQSDTKYTVPTQEVQQIELTRSAV